MGSEKLNNGNNEIDLNKVKKEIESNFKEDENVTNYIHDDELFKDFLKNEYLLRFVTSKELEKFAAQMKLKDYKMLILSQYLLRQKGEKEIISYILKNNKYKEINGEKIYEIKYESDEQFVNELGEIYKPFLKYLNRSGMLSRAKFVDGKTKIIVTINSVRDYNYISNIEFINDLDN